MHLIHSKILLLAALPFASLACSDSAEPGFEDCSESSVTIEVSAGLTPTFSWSPACGVAFLYVTQGEGNILWMLRAATGTSIPNPIASGLRYGRTPRHGHVWEGPEPLQAGRVYEVYVGRRRCELSDACNPWVVGALQFIP